MDKENSRDPGACQPSDQRLAVWALVPEKEALAEELARKLGASLFCGPPARPMLTLRLEKDGPALCYGPRLVLKPGFERMLPRLQRGRLERELLVRAAKPGSFITALKAPVAIDATAGLGEDALLLAAAGFQVELVEYNPLIAFLLASTLERAERHPMLAEIAGRMRLHEGDSRFFLQEWANPPELILLDPMFPPRKKSAKVKKKIQLFQMIERPCNDETALLAAAFAANPRKILIKRPAKGPPLAGHKPAYSLSGEAIRIDCLTPNPQRKR